MQKTLASMLFAATFVAAKGVTPWAHKPLPVGNAPPFEAAVSAWKDGGWALLRKTGYVYDAEGALTHADLWSSSPIEGGYQGTWSWDFAYGEGGFLSGISERVRLDSAWRDTAHMPLQLGRALRSAGGEAADVDLIWHRGRLIWGSQVRKGFDASGREISRIELVFDGSGWRTLAASVQTYDAAGRLLTRTTEGSHQEVHAYDARGNLLSSEWSTWLSGGWRIESSETREYDAAGRLATIMEQRVPEGSAALAPSRKSVHAYPDPAIHETVVWGWDGFQWVRRSLESVRVDLRGNPIERLTFVPSDSGWLESEKSVLAFDGRNNLVADSRYVMEGIHWVLAESSHYAYDAGDRRISGSQERFSLGAETGREESLFRYDARGNLLERSLQWFSPAGAVLGGERETFAYAPAASLPPRGREARAKVFRRAAHRGGAFLILEENAIRDLQGRAYPAR